MDPMRSLLLALMVSLLGLASACGDQAPPGNPQAGPLPQDRTMRGASGETWLAGKHYEVIAASQAVTLNSSHPIRVVEFFWYECPHCYRLEPHLVLWNR